MRIFVLFASLLLLTALLVEGGSMAPAASLPVLERPSLLSDRAAGAVMLDVTRAGSRLVAVGERGIVMLSDDDGDHWGQVETPVRTSLTAVQFVGPDTGWAVGHLGVVLHTTDGGKHWEKQLDGDDVIALRLDAAKRRAAAEPDETVREDILYFADLFAGDGPDKPFLNLYFVDDQRGFVFGAFNMILRTEDGGASWRVWGDRLENQMEMHLYDMAEVGETLWLAGEQGLLLKSDDGGQHFSEAASPYMGSYFGLLSDPAGTLVLYGLQGNVYRSEDGGETWEKIDTGIAVTFSAGLTLAGGDMALLSQAGDLMVSRDGGRSFQRLPDGEGMPATGLAQAGDGSFILSSLRGMHRVSNKQPLEAF